MSWVNIVVSIISTTVNYYQQEQARKDAEEARKEQEEQANKQYALAKEAAERQKKQIAKTEAEAMKLESETKSREEQIVMRNRRRRQSGETGFSSTILTSPLGVTGQTGAGKTLLGE